MRISFWIWNLMTLSKFSSQWRQKFIEFRWDLACLSVIILEFITVFASSKQAVNCILFIHSSLFNVTVILIHAKISVEIWFIYKIMIIWSSILNIEVLGKCMHLVTEKTSISNVDVWHLIFALDFVNRARIYFLSLSRAFSFSVFFRNM